jgi:hypothetical protein
LVETAKQTKEESAVEERHFTRQTKAHIDSVAAAAVNSASMTRPIQDRHDISSRQLLIGPPSQSGIFDRLLSADNQAKRFQNLVIGLNSKFFCLRIHAMVAWVRPGLSIPVIRPLDQSLGSLRQHLPAQD